MPCHISWSSLWGTLRYRNLSPRLITRPTYILHTGYKNRGKHAPECLQKKQWEGSRALRGYYMASEKSARLFKYILPLASIGIIVTEKGVKETVTNTLTNQTYLANS